MRIEKMIGNGEKITRNGYLKISTMIYDESNLHGGFFCWASSFSLASYSSVNVCGEPTWEEYYCRRCNAKKVINREWFNPLDMIE